MFSENHTYKMMSKLVLLFGSILLVGVFYFVESSSSQRYIGNAVHKDYPGMCFYNDTQTPIKIGQTLRPTSECVQIYCREDFVLYLLYCPRYMLGDGCEVTFDVGAEFPKCCADIKCPKRFPGIK
ncbi:uncharacterized protein LOC129911084 [Episyrphus balteatus]|uniref:uncharacterized protein LOC129911084 n=1 Tax=Episyrphus balteatus TaxID=286459 RepID=UPI002485E66F|nr:uncharacterized protein LOC129911084 [Episyrphus balteatus]